MRCINKPQSRIIRCIIGLDFLPINKAPPTPCTHTHTLSTSLTTVQRCAGPFNAECAPVFRSPRPQMCSRGISARMTQNAVKLKWRQEENRRKRDEFPCQEPQIGPSLLTRIVYFFRCGWMLRRRSFSLWGPASGCCWLSPATTVSQTTVTGKN